MAITLDARTEFTTTTGADPESFSHTIGAGATLLVLLIGHRNGNASNAVGATWNGTEALTKVRNDVVASTGSAHTEIWYRINPTSGTHTVAIDFGAAPATDVISAVSLFGTDTSSPIDNHNGTSGVDNLSQTIATTAANCWILDVSFVRGTNTTIAWGAQTGRTNYSTPWDTEWAGNEGSGGGSKFENVAAATYTCDWSYVAPASTALSIVAIKPAAASASITPTVGSAVLTGAAPRMNFGIIVPTEV